MTAEEIAVKHCKNGHNPAQCQLLTDIKRLSGLFDPDHDLLVKCGCGKNQLVVKDFMQDARSPHVAAEILNTAITIACGCGIVAVV